MLVSKAFPKMLLAAARQSRQPARSSPNISSFGSRHFSSTTISTSSSSGSFDGHTLNCSKALKKADEGRFFSDLMNDPVSTLEGIGPDRSEALVFLGVHTIKDLSNYKHFHIARAIETMAKTEIAGDRPVGSIMNINEGVDKEYETKSLQEIADAPVSALMGIGDKKSEAWKHMGVVTVRDLANLKYCRWAESIVALSGCEDKNEQASVEEEDTTSSESAGKEEKDEKWAEIEVK